MKIYRLVRAELRKIFLRPTIFIMVALLLLCSFLTLILFNPDQRATDSKVSTVGGTVGQIYNDFTQDSSSTTFTTKYDLDKKLEESLNDLKSFTVADTLLSEFKQKANETKAKYDTLAGNLESAARPIYGSDNDKLCKNANDSLKDFKTSLTAMNNKFFEFGNSNRYYLTSTKFEEMSDTLKDLFDSIIVYSSTQPAAVYNNLLTSLRKFDFKNLVDDFVDNLETIMISEEKFEEIKSLYHTPAIIALNGLEPEASIAKDEGEVVDESVSEDEGEVEGEIDEQNKSLFEKIKAYYDANSTEGGQEYRDEFTNLISDYKAYINLACENLECAKQLAISENISDKTMQSYLGYSSFNKLTTSSTLQKNAYIIDNNINPRTTLDTMNFGVNSGNETNAWDFICFSMNITSLLIVVFCVIICSKMIAGEQASGTMKMLAIRPYSRNKILGGKLISTMFFSMIFIGFSFIISFGIGWAFFGLPHQMMIGVFNGTNVIYAHPIVFCIFLLLSLCLKVFIYVSIATMISVLFRSYTGSSMISFAIVILTIILNGILGTKHYFKYFPMSNFDIYKYFTTSQSASGFKAIFSSPLIIDTSFVFTFVYAIIMILILNGISFLMFNKKDIA